MRNTHVRVLPSVGPKAVGACHMQNSIQPFLCVRRAGIRRQLQSGGSSSSSRRRHMADMQINTRAAWIARFIFLFHLLPLFVPLFPVMHTLILYALSMCAWIHPLFLSRCARVFFYLYMDCTHQSLLFCFRLKNCDRRAKAAEFCGRALNNDLFGSSPDFFAWSLADDLLFY